MMFGSLVQVRDDTRPDNVHFGSKMAVDCNIEMACGHAARCSNAAAWCMLPDTTVNGRTLSKLHVMQTICPWWYHSMIMRHKTDLAGILCN